MSQENIITQPLGDPVGSIYEVDGKCYIKTSNASGTMNKLVRNPTTQECATDATVDLVKCETGSGARQATVSTGGGYFCRGDARSIDNINFINDMTSDVSLKRRNRQTWPLGYSAPGGTLGPRGQGIDIAEIPYQPHHTKGSTRTENANGDPHMSIMWCKILHGGWVRFAPASVINGFDEFFYWGRGNWPFYRPVGWYRFSVQHAETDEWHVVKYYTASYFRSWLGYMLGYTESQTNRINTRAYAMGNSLHPHVHLTPRNDEPYFQVDPKFHNMPIKSVEVYYKTGTMFVFGHYIHTLQLYKNGEKQNLMDNSIVLRSAPATTHGALM